MLRFASADAGARLRLQYEAIDRRPWWRPFSTPRTRTFLGQDVVVAG